MYKTKRDVDKQVSDIVGRIRDPQEKLKKGYHIAKLYYDIKEYEVARHYLSSYLRVKGDFAQAHKLMGEILEAQNKIERAVDAFRCSLELNDKQKDVVLKICDLYSRLDIDPERARFWAEKAEKIDHNHPVVYRLRERIYTFSDAEPCQKDLEVLYTDELVKRPYDATLRMRLLRLYIDQERTNEAYNHVIEIERRRPYHDNLEWYQTVVEVLEVYQSESGVNANGSFHYQLLQALAAIVGLSLTKTLTNATDALLRFDAGLFAADKQTNNNPEWPEFMAEMRAQFFFYAGTLLLKRFMKSDWTKASRLAAACYLVSYAKERPETQSAWYASASKANQQSFQHWCNDASYRLSQTGHVLMNMADDHHSAWTTNIKNELCTVQGCRYIFDQLYAGSAVAKCSKTSFLYQQPPEFTDFFIRLPTTDQLRKYDDVSHQIRPEDLSRLVWIAMHYYDPKQVQPDYGFRVFDSLCLSTKCVDTSAPESLCQLDTDAFFYATVYNACFDRQQRQRLQKEDIQGYSTCYLSTGSLQLDHLPYVLSENLCSKTQADWWSVTYKMYMNRPMDNLHHATMRSKLIHGLGVIRAIGSSEMDVKLVIHLAKIFQQRESEVLARVTDRLDYAAEAERYRSRAKLYWTRALDMMSRTGRSLSVLKPRELLFPALGDELTPIQIKDYKRDANFYLACDLMKCGKHEEAIEAFDQLVLPYASYYQGKIYFQLGEEAFGNRPLGEMAEEHKEKYLALLDKAKEAFYTTCDRLRNEKHHVLHQLLATDITEVENLIATVRGDNQDDPWPGQNCGAQTVYPDLSRIVGDTTMYAPGGATRHSSAPPDSHVCSTPYRPTAVRSALQDNSILINSSMNTALNGVSPEKPRRIPPSPERLEAMIRCLQQKQDMFTNSLEVSIRELVNANRSLQQEMKELKVSMDIIRVRWDEMAARPIPPLATYPPHFPPPYPPSMPPTAIYQDYMKHNQFMSPQYTNPALSSLQNLAQVSTPQHCESRPSAHEGYEHGFEDENFSQEDDFLDQQYFPKDRNYVADHELVQEWPNGNIAEVKGTSTVTYQPQSNLTMPGPGFFARDKADINNCQKAGLLGTAPQAENPSPQFVFDARQTNQSSAGNTFSSLKDERAERRPTYEKVVELPKSVVEAKPLVPSVVVENKPEAKEQTRPSITTGFLKLPAVAEPTKTESTPRPFAGFSFDMKSVKPPAIAEPTKTEPTPSPFSGLSFDMKSVKPPAVAEPTKTEPTPSPFPGLSFDMKSVKPPAVAEPTKTEPTPSPFPGLSLDKKSVKPPAVAEPTKTEPTSSPFAGFSFGMTSTKQSSVVGDSLKSLLSAPSKDETDSSDRTSKPETGAMLFGQNIFGSQAGTVFGQGSSFDTTFASLAAKGNNSQTNPAKPLPFASPGPSLTSVKSPGVDDPHAYEAQSDFKPLIDLPELVKFSSGEEDESKLFGERGVLYRYDPTTQAWKERGSGELKIMKNNKTSRCRIIMRREQVHKVCANHVIAESMNLIKMSTSSRTWCWTAHDFSDPEEPTTEKFAIKFKTEDLAARFKQVFDECQRNMPKSTENSPEKEGKEDIASKFKLKFDEWECDACYTRNPAIRTKCMACDAVKKNEDTSTAGIRRSLHTPKTDAKSQAIFDKFKIKEDEWECRACLVRNKSAERQCVVCKEKNPNGPADDKPVGLQFGSASPGGGFIFGGSVTPGNFGSSSGSTPVFGASFGGGATSTPANNNSLFGSQSSGFKFETSGPKVEGGFKFGSDANQSTPSSFQFGQTANTKETSTTVGEATPFGQTSTLSFGTPGTLNKAFDFSTPKSAINVGQTFLASTPVRAVSPQLPTTPAVLSAPLAGGFKFGDQSTTFSFSGVTPSKTTGLGKPAALAKSPLSPKSPDDHYHQEEDDSHIYFEPIVPLPDKVEVQTGEENETEKFSHRAKLYRFVNNEWKERGLGNVKVLEHNETKKLRVVMRRDQVKKLCLNSNILPDIELQPMKGGKGVAWIWSAMDFSEGEARPEQFCIRFKLPEIANDFKAAFEATATRANTSANSVENFSFKLDDADISGTKVPESFTFQSPSPSPSTSTFTFGERFKTSPAAGPQTSPLCAKLACTKAPQDDADGDCIITKVEMPSAEDRAAARKLQLPETFYNYKTAPPCPGCAGCTDTMPVFTNTGDDDDVAIADVLATSPTVVERRRVDSERETSHNLPDDTLYEKKKTPCKGCCGCEKCTNKVTSTATAASKPVFGATAAAMPAPPLFGSAVTSTTVFGGGSVFGAGRSGSSLGSFAELANVPVAGFAGKGSDKPFTWTGAGASVFGQGAESSSDDTVTTDDPHYEPIIPLPELVESTTGEENEDCIWSHRCKLFRYDGTARAWKERAIGDIKVLKHKESVRYRLVMRREQVKKMALNHVLGLELDLQPMKTSETSWCWYAQDFADPSLNPGGYEQFAVKFKTKEIAEQFRDKFLECQRMLRFKPDMMNAVETASTLASESVATSSVTGNVESDSRQETVDGDVHEEGHSEGASDVHEEGRSEEAGDDDDEDYEDVQDDEPLFEKRCSMTRRVNNQVLPMVMGTLTVYEAEYGYGDKIRMEQDNGTPIAEHYIAIETRMLVDKKKKTAEWNALDFSDGETGTQMIFTAQFSSANALDEFEELLKHCIESANDMAFTERDLVTDIHEIDEPEVVGQIQEDEGDYTGN